MSESEFIAGVEKYTALLSHSPYADYRAAMSRVYSQVYSKGYDDGRKTLAEITARLEKAHEALGILVDEINALTAQTARE